MGNFILETRSLETSRSMRKKRRRGFYAFATVVAHADELSDFLNIPQH